MNRALRLAAISAACALSCMLSTRAFASTDARAARILVHVRAAFGSIPHANASALHLHGALTILGVSGSEDVYAIPARRAFLEVDRVGALSGRTGFTGTAAWSSDEYGIVRKERFPSVRQHIVNQAYRATNGLVNPSQWPALIQFSGEKLVDGVRIEVLRVRPAGGSPFYVWVSAATWLPIRILQPLGDGAAVTALGEYRSFNGVRIPTLQRTMEGGNTAVFNVTSVSFNDSKARAALSVHATSVHDFSINGGQTASVPFDLVENHVYVRAFLNGKGPYTFILDTGGVNIVTPQVISDLHEVQQGGGKIGGVGAKRESIRFSRIRTVDIGSARLRNQDFLVLDIGQSFGVATGMHVDGLLGHEVLARFITTFDYGARRITFMLAAGQPPHLSNPIDFAFNGDTPHIRANVDGIRGWFTVDTGARVSLSLTTPFVAAHPSVAPFADAPTGALGYGVGGGALGRLGRIHALQIGKFNIQNLITAFSATSSGALSASNIAGNIGGGVWKRFAITFDYPDQRIGLQPDAAFDAPDTYDRSGMFLVDNGGTLKVYDVLTHTPAAAEDIRKGDIITAIDGEQRSLQAARELLQGPAGTRITLTLTRAAGRPITINLVLANYI